MRSEQQVLNRIKEILKDEPKGMSITEISAKINLNRNSVAKYINMLQISGQVEMQTRAAAKIFYPARRLPIAEIVSVSSDAVILVDEALHVVQTNDAVLTLLNLMREGIENQSVLDLIAPIEGLEGALVHLKQALAGEKAETEITLRADKEDCCFRVQFIPILFEDGANGVALVFADISSQQKMEKALEESDERYRDLYENSPIANFSIGTDGRIRRCNRRAAEMLGYTVEELVGRPVFELYANTPEGKTKAHEVFERFLQSRAIRDEELLMQKADGSPLWICLTVNAVRDAQGNLVESCSTAVDITERKNAERDLEKYRAHLEELVAERTADLQRSEERLRMALEGANEGLWDREVDTGRAYFSPRYYTMLGYEPGEFPPSYETWKSLVHPDDLDAALQKLNDHDAGKNPRYETMFRMRARSGEYRWILSRGGVTERDAEGRARRIVGTHTDITDRKQAREALRRAEGKKQHILDSAIGLFAYYDTDLRILWCNQAAADSVAQPRDKLIGRHCYEIWAQRNEPCESCPLMRALSTVEPQDAEIETPDGRIWFVRGQPIFDNEGKVTNLIEFCYDITERRRTEGALQAANAYNRSLIEASLDPLVTISPDGRITDVNAATETVTGYPRDALIGTDFSDYFTDPAMARAGYRQAFEDGQARNYPLEILHRDGTVTPVLYNATVYRDDQGNITGVFAAARDVTEHKRAEEALTRHTEELTRLNRQLEESREQYRCLFEYAPDMIAVHDGDRYIYVNPAGMRLLHVEDPADIIGKSVMIFLHHDYREIVKTRIEQMRQMTTDVPQIEEKLLTLDGKVVDVEVAAHPFFCQGKKLIHLIARDITRRKRAEDALRESEERFRYIAEHSLDIIYMLDREGRFTYVSPSTERITGYTPEETLGQSFMDYIPESEVPKAYRAQKKALEGEELLQFQLNFMGKNGDPVPLECNASPAYKNGIVVGSQGIARNITHRE